MKKIKIVRSTQRLSCPMETSFVSVNKCRVCNHCFSIVPFEAVLCTKGKGMDVFIKRPKNRKLK